MSDRFVDSADGTRLRIVVTGTGDRDVLVVHGLAEHAERYDHVARAFAEKGWTFSVVELRGHGRSGGRRSHVHAWSEYVDDVKAAAATLRPGWVLLAHSMGGLVALSALQAGLAPARVALSNPLIGLSVKVPAAKVLAGKVLSKLWPTLALTNEIDPAELSRDLAVGTAYAADPMVYNKVTGRWYTEMVAAMARVGTFKPSMPSQLFLGGADRINSPVASRAWAQAAGVPIREWPEMRHELVNELGKDEVIAELEAFLR